MVTTYRDAAFIEGSHEPKDHDPETGLKTSSHSASKAVEHCAIMDKRKADFLTSLLSHHLGDSKTDEKDEVELELPRFLWTSIFLVPFWTYIAQELVHMISVSLDVAKVIEDRRTESRQMLSDHEIEKLTWTSSKKTPPSSISVGWSALAVILLVAISDFAARMVVGSWVKGIWLESDDANVLESLLLQAAEFRPLLRLLEKNTERVSMQYEWYRLVTCMIVHIDWKDTLFGLGFLWLNASFIPLIPRIGIKKFFWVMFLASLGGSLCHFHLAPNETEVGSHSIGFLIIGMFYADMVVNHDILMTVVRLRLGKCPNHLWCSYPALCFAGLTGLVCMVLCLLQFKWTSPVAMMAYLVYGFCLSLSFIPRLDKKHPGFLGNGPTSWWQKMGGNVCYAGAVISMVYFGLKLIVGKDNVLLSLCILL